MIGLAALVVALLAVIVEDRVARAMLLVTAVGLAVAALVAVFRG